MLTLTLELFSWFPLTLALGIEPFRWRLVWDYTRDNEGHIFHLVIGPVFFGGLYYAPKQ